MARPVRIRSLRLLIVVGIMAVAFGFPGTQRSLAASRDTATLNVTYNANGTISVSLPDGTSVGSATSPGTTIPPGTYSIVFNNRAQVVHMFHLAGPGVKLVTDLKPIGEDAMCAGITGLYTLQTYTETFLPNSTYSFQDDYQPSIHAFFSTSSASTTVTTSTGKTNAGSGGLLIGSSSFGSVLVPERGVLLVSVGTAGRLVLTYEGRHVTSLKPGRYTIKVTDGSHTDGFMLQKGKRSTVIVAGIGFVGSASRELNLTAGQWFFFPSRSAKKSPLTVGS
jgi:hypothetical protein